MPSDYLSDGVFSFSRAQQHHDVTRLARLERHADLERAARIDRRADRPRQPRALERSRARYGSISSEELAPVGSIVGDTLADRREADVLREIGVEIVSREHRLCLLRSEERRVG